MVNKQPQGRAGSFRDRGRKPEVLGRALTVEKTHSETRQREEEVRLFSGIQKPGRIRTNTHSSRL